MLVLGGACGWVVGGSGRRVLPLQAGGLACAGGQLVVGCLAVLVAPVVSGVGVIPSPLLGSAVVGVVPVVAEGVDAVGGWRCCCDAAVCCAGDVVGEGSGGAPGVGAPRDADSEGVVGDALLVGGALKVPWGWDPATPARGARGYCWPVRWPWRCWSSLVSGRVVVSLVPMALQVWYGVMSRARALWVVLLRLP